MKQALQIPEWRNAMHYEFNALLANNTWELVPSHAHPMLVGYKWVFRIKQTPDGTINIYKHD